MHSKHKIENAENDGVFAMWFFLVFCINSACNENMMKDKFLSIASKWYAKNIKQITWNNVSIALVYARLLSWVSDMMPNFISVCASLCKCCKGKIGKFC